MIVAGELKPLIEYEKLGKNALLSIPLFVKTPSVAELTTCSCAPVSPRYRFPRAARRCNIVTSPPKTEY